MRRSAPLLLLAAPLVLTAPTTAQTELWVASPAGNLYSTPPDGGPFTLEAETGLPLRSIAEIGSDLFLGAATGEVLRFPTDGGTLTHAFHVASDAAAMAAHAGELLIGGQNGQVLRVDPASGTVLGSLDAKLPVEAIVVDGDVVYVGTSNGAFLEADLGLGESLSVAGVSGGPVSSMGQTADDLYLGESEGNVFVFDKETELSIYAYPVDSDVTSLVRHGDTFLIGGSNAKIHRVVQVIGTVLETFVAPEPIQAMWLRQPLGTLATSDLYLSTAVGGQVGFELSVAGEHAGSIYLLLGSLSGTEPGISGSGLHLALNADAYFASGLSLGGSLIDAPLGTFDALGQASAVLTAPPLPLALSGSTAHHAFVVLDAQGPSLVIGTSDPVPTFIY